MALEHYARQAQNIEAERKAAEIRAERKAGQLLKETEKGHGPGRGKKNSNGAKSFYAKSLQRSRRC